MLAIRPTLIMTRSLPWRNILVHVLGALPLLLTFYEYLTGTLPIVLDRHLVIRFGAVGLAFLIASFSITTADTPRLAR